MNSEFVAGVDEFRAGASVVVGGPGWADVGLQDGMRQASSLDEAIRLLTA
jgi:hypothetical protein